MVKTKPDRRRPPDGSLSLLWQWVGEGGQRGLFTALLHMVLGYWEISEELTVYISRQHRCGSALWIPWIELTPWAGRHASIAEYDCYLHVANLETSWMKCKRAVEPVTKSFHGSPFLNQVCHLNLSWKAVSGEMVSVIPQKWKEHLLIETLSAGRERLPTCRGSVDADLPSTAQVWRPPLPA